MMLAQVLLAAERALRGNAKVSGPEQVKQALILEYRLPLGCCVHMTPVFEALKLCRPDVRITVATRGLGSQVLRHSPMIDDLIVTPDPLTDLGSTVSALRRQLRSPGTQPNCVLTGASDQRSRIALLGMLASSGWRGGYTQMARLYQRPLQYDAGLSLIDNNLRVAKLVGCDRTVSRPRVFFSSDDAAVAGELLREANPEGKPLLVMVTQNSGGQNTGWHTERFVEVLHAAQARGCAVVYVGTPSDEVAIQNILQATDGIGRSIAGKTTVTQLAAVLATSDLTVTLDTGTMHVGRAIGIPMVVLGPSWQKPLEWLPLGVENVRILRGPDREDVPPGYRLDEISAASVIAAMDELLAKYPPSSTSRSERIADSLSHVDHIARAASVTAR